MMKLFQALCPGDKIVEEYAEVCELAQRLMMLAVKENIRSSPANKERMFHYLVKIEELERDVLKKISPYELEIATKRPHSCGTAHQTRLIISYKALLPLKKI